MNIWLFALAMANVFLDGTPCRDRSWAEMQATKPVDPMEIGDATCAQMKAYHCGVVEDVIYIRFRETSCEAFVHADRTGVSCCLFTATSCGQMLDCFERRLEKDKIR